MTSLTHTRCFGISGCHCGWRTIYMDKMISWGAWIRNFNETNLYSMSTIYVYTDTIQQSSCSCVCLTVTMHSEFISVYLLQLYLTYMLHKTMHVPSAMDNSNTSI